MFGGAEKAHAGRSRSSHSEKEIEARISQPEATRFRAPLHPGGSRHRRQRVERSGRAPAHTVAKLTTATPFFEIPSFGRNPCGVGSRSEWRGQGLIQCDFNRRALIAAVISIATDFIAFDRL